MRLDIYPESDFHLYFDETVVQVAEGEYEGCLAYPIRCNGDTYEVYIVGEATNVVTLPAAALATWWPQMGAINYGGEFAVQVGRQPRRISRRSISMQSIDHNAVTFPHAKAVPWQRGNAHLRTLWLSLLNPRHVPLVEAVNRMNEGHEYALAINYMLVLTPARRVFVNGTMAGVLSKDGAEFKPLDRACILAGVAAKHLRREGVEC